MVGSDVETIFFILIIGASSLWMFGPTSSHDEQNGPTLIPLWLFSNQPVSKAEELNWLLMDEMKNTEMQ